MDLISLVVTILVVGLVLWLLLYVIDMIPLPPPFAQVAKAIVIIIGVIFLIKILLNVSGVHLAL